MIKKFAFSILMISAFFVGKIEALIIETSHLEEVLCHQSPGAVFCFDLDDTLITPGQYFGSIQWFEDYARKLTKKGISPDDAGQMAYALWLEMAPFLPMILVDEASPEILEKIRSEGSLILGLTARHSVQAELTHVHLGKRGIKFDHFPPNQEIFFQEPALYEKGILFCGDYWKKSEVLLAFLKERNISPEKIIFVDDRLKHVQDLEEALASCGIDYVGIHYTKVNKNDR